MEYITIKVPDMNDSMSKVVLNGSVCHIRFTYNDTKGFWKFGLYDSNKEPIVLGIKIVPDFPLNIFCCTKKDVPWGIFSAACSKPKIGRSDFENGDARFIFTPLPE